MLKVKIEQGEEDVSEEEDGDDDDEDIDDNDYDDDIGGRKVCKNIGARWRNNKNRCNYTCFGVKTKKGGVFTPKKHV